MNAQRRKDIAQAQAVFENGMLLLNEAKDLLEAAVEDEQEYFDNMPESLQGGEKGQSAEAAIEAMNTLIEAIDEVDGAADWDTMAA